MTSAALAPIKEFIAASCGLRFDDSAGKEKLAFALSDRMRESGAADQERYLDRIKADKEEFQRLVNLLTINETYFFREPDQLRLLTERLVPRLLIRNDGSAPVKILSAGCSSGEEPYSLVMSLWERYGESLPRFCSVTGVDIDSAVLAKARNGHYGEFSFRGVATEMRSRYFEKSSKGWQVKGDIRSLVTFQELNLLSGELPQALKDTDIIFFRNVSIYFDEETRIRIQKNLHALLKDDGILVIGCSETIANDLGVFEMVEEEGLFYFIKGCPPLPEHHLPLIDRSRSVSSAAAPRLQPAPAPDLPLPVLTLPASWQLPAARAHDIEQLRRLVHQRSYDEALPHLEMRLAADPLDQDALLLKANVLLNRKQFETVRSLARQVLEQTPWCIDAFMLLGLAAKWDEKADEALNWFKQSVYACHTCWPARYHLADIYGRNGETELARREYRSVLQLLSRNVTDTGISVVSLGLQAAETRLVCERQLAKLDSRTTG